MFVRVNRNIKCDGRDLRGTLYRQGQTGQVMCSYSGQFMYSQQG